MRLLSAALLLAAAPAVAEDSLSAEIAANGISATHARLAALSAPADAELFALGGLEFLGAVEAALQARWQVQFSPQLDMLPVLRLPVGANPAPGPFTAGLVSEILTGLDTGMLAARDALLRIDEGSDFGLRIRLADLWFDINGNGSRDPGEDLLDTAAGLLFAGTGFDRGFAEGMEIRFDVADSRWLGAYSQLIRGTAQVILAFDPTAAITEVMETKAALRELNEGSQMANAIDYMVGEFVDSAGVLLIALRAQPDADRGRAALEAFEEVITLNRDFWRLIEAETDNEAEWIPNDRQVSVLGLDFPEGTAGAWQEVLADFEALLQGELLLPYWRLGADLGLDLRQMFLDPRPVDPVDWVLGTAALPYVATGPRISSESLRRFDGLMQGRGLMFAAILN